MADNDTSKLGDKFTKRIAAIANDKKNPKTSEEVIEEIRAMLESGYTQGDAPKVAILSLDNFNNSSLQIAYRFAGMEAVKLILQFASSVLSKEEQYELLGHKNEFGDLGATIKYWKKPTMKEDIKTYYEFLRGFSSEHTTAPQSPPQVEVKPENTTTPEVKKNDSKPTEEPAKEIATDKPVDNQKDTVERNTKRDILNHSSGLKVKFWPTPSEIRQLEKGLTPSSLHFDDIEQFIQKRINKNDMIPPDEVSISKGKKLLKDTLDKIKEILGPYSRDNKVGYTPREVRFFKRLPTYVFILPDGALGSIRRTTYLQNRKNGKAMLLAYRDSVKEEPFQINTFKSNTDKPKTYNRNGGSYVSGQSNKTYNKKPSDKVETAIHDGTVYTVDQDRRINPLSFDPNNPFAILLDLKDGAHRKYTNIERPSAFIDKMISEDSFKYKDIESIKVIPNDNVNTPQEEVEKQQRYLNSAISKNLNESLSSDLKLNFKYNI